MMTNPVQDEKMLKNIKFNAHSIYMNKGIKHFFGKNLAILSLVLVFVNRSMGQEMINMSTANCTISSNEIQMDILVTNTSKAELRWNSCVIRMNIPAALSPAGEQKYAITYRGGSDFPSSFPSTGGTLPGSFFNSATRLLSWSSSPNIAYSNLTCNAPLIAAGQTKKIGRFSFKITSSKFLKGAAAGLTWHTTSSCILYEGCSPNTVGFGNAANRILTNPCTLKVPE